MDDVGDSRETERDKSLAGGSRRTLGGLQPAHIAGWVLAVLVSLSLLWIGGELHYQGCVDAAAARNAGNDALSRLVRTEDVESCSLLP